MADVTQSVTWQFRLDLSELSEAEKRIQTLLQQQKQLERGPGNSNEVITQTNQRTRARDSETASIERQNRALDANATARRRAAAADTGMMHGPLGRPALGMHGPAYDFRGGAIPYAEQGARRAWMGNLVQAISQRYANGGGGAAPSMGDTDPMYAAMAARAAANPAPAGSLHVPMWGDLGRTQFNPAWLSQQYGLPRTQLGTTRGGLQYMRTPTGVPSYLPGGFGDPRGRLSMNQVQLSPAYLAAAGFGPGGARGFGLRGAQIPNLMQAVMGFGAALDPGNSLSSRLAHAGYAASNAAYIANAGGPLGAMVGRVGAFAGGIALPTAAIAAPVGIGLEGARRYYQGEADYQAQIGAQYDYRFAMNNLWRDRGTELERLRSRQRGERLGFYRDFRDMQFQRGDSLIREQSSYDRINAGTYTDTVERVAAQREQLRNATSEQQRIKHNLQRAQERLAGARTDADKSRLTRVVQEYQERLSASAERIFGIQGGLQRDASSLIGRRDEAQTRLDELNQDVADSPIYGATYQYRRRRDSLQKQFEEADRAVQQSGYGGLSGDFVNTEFGRRMRNQAGIMQGSGNDARNTGDQAGYLEGISDLNESQLEELKKLNENFTALLEAVKRPAEPERSGVNAFFNSPTAANWITGIGPLGGIEKALGFISQGE